MKILSTVNHSLVGSMLRAWTSGEHLAGLARKMCEFPFPVRGAHVAVNPFYRVMWLHTSGYIGDLEVKPHKMCESWAASKAGAECYLKDAYDTPHGVNGITVIVEYQFSPEDVIVHLPTAIAALPETEQEGFFDKTGYTLSAYMTHDEVLVRSRPITIPRSKIMKVG